MKMMKMMMIASLRRLYINFKFVVKNNLVGRCKKNPNLLFSLENGKIFDEQVSK